MTVVSSYTIATVLSLQTLCTCIIFTLGQYIYTFYLQSYPFSSYVIQNLTNDTVQSFLHKIKKTPEKCTQRNISLDSPAQAWAQQRSADLFFWTNVWSCVPIIIMTYFLGLYTPKLGRRFVLLLPMVGTTIQLGIWLSIIYYRLPEYWWYIASFIVGLSGADNVRSIDLK
jgi:MFS family permease